MQPNRIVTCLEKRIKKEKKKKEDQAYAVIENLDGSEKSVIVCMHIYGVWEFIFLKLETVDEFIFFLVRQWR